MGCPIDPDAAGGNIARHAGQNAPPPLKLMAARGLAPMPPVDLVTTQFILTFEGDQTVASQAEKSLREMDNRIANAILSDTSISPHVLGFLAPRLVQNDAFMEKILLNPRTPNAAFVEAALSCSEKTGEIVANNQSRLLETPEIAVSLIQNDKVLRSTAERVVDFLVRSGVLLEGVTEFEDAMARLSGEEKLAAVQDVVLPSQFLDPSFASESGDISEDLGLSEEDLDDESERQMISDDDEDIEEEKLTVEQWIRSLNAGKKVAAALKGNKQVRSILIRDTNRVVALAAVQSPAITQGEIVAAAQSRSVHADVINNIVRDRKNNWVKEYPIKLALVNNPKTPIPDALRLLSTLYKRDIKSVSKSRNVSGPVRVMATRMVKGQVKKS